MRLYFSHRRLFDYGIAAIVTFAARIISLPHGPVFYWPTGSGLQTFALAVAASAASLLGFVLAANTFLISHTQHRRLSILRHSGGFKQLIDIMSSNLWRLLALAVYSGAITLISTEFESVALDLLLFLIAANIISFSVLIWATMSVLAVPLD